MLLRHLIHNFLVFVFADKQFKTVHWYNCTKERSLVLQRLGFQEIEAPGECPSLENCHLQLKRTNPGGQGLRLGNMEPLSKLLKVAAKMPPLRES